MKSTRAMIPFLRSVAEEIISRNGADLSRFIFVMPGKRAGMFLQRHIEDIVESHYTRRVAPSELPGIITFAELAEKIDGRRTGTPLELLFALYAARREIRTDGSDFEQFRSWGETVLRDFDEIDMYDVDASALFLNIERNNEISTDYLSPEQRSVVKEYFGVERGPRSESFWQHYNSGPAKRFQELWQQLDPLYNLFNRRLANSEFAYTGALVRRSADLLQQGHLPDSLKGKRIIIVGFDSLTTAQIRLFSGLQKLRDEDMRPVADFFWDTPGTPLQKDSPIDAGRSVRIYKRLFPCSIEGMDNYTAHLSFPPRLDVIACPGNTAQAKVSGKLLADILADRGSQFIDPARIAIVLPDESLLFPMYYSMPEEIAADVNLTMGYPVKSTSVASFVMLLRRLQRSVRRHRGEYLFFFREVRTMLSHPFVQMMLGVPVVERLQGFIISRHLFYLGAGQLIDALGDDDTPQRREVIMQVFRAMTRTTDGGEACAMLKECLLTVIRHMVLSSGIKEMKRLDITLLQSYVGTIEEFVRLAEPQGLLSVDWRTAMSMLDTMMRNYTVHLQGQPLTGIQIMGMLETRALDFDYLIIPSMNERIFPRRMRVHTFIPDSLRRGWQLPTLRQKEQAIAYHFYRLIARAREVHLLYDASQSGLRSGDPSRYLLQLKHLFADEPKLTWRSARFNINTPVHPILQAEKQEEDLRPFLTPGSGHNLSASNLKDYIDCSLRFYLAHILKKKLHKEPEEFMDAATQGTVLHDTMQALYDSLLPAGFRPGDTPPVRRIEKSTIRGWLDGSTLSLRDLVRSMVRRHYPAAAEMDELSGDALLMAEVIEVYARSCLEADLLAAPFEYLDNEHKITTVYEFEEGRKVNMTFIIDRLDRLFMRDGTGRLRIVDYKTGSDDLSFSKVGELFHPRPGQHSKGIFQLMLYSLLYPVANTDFPSDAPIALSIYRTRKLQSSDYATMVEGSDGPVYSNLPYMEEYKQTLDAMLHELFDLNEPFRQNADSSKCTFCDFKQLCGRD